MVELCAVEGATTTRRELNMAKAHLAKIKAVLQKSLEALEVERKA